MSRLFQGNLSGSPPLTTQTLTKYSNASLMLRRTGASTSSDCDLRLVAGAALGVELEGHSEVDWPSVHLRVVLEKMQGWVLN